jgi:opacity protein-like surface antigen
MNRSLLMLALSCFSLPVTATDITLLYGQQFNSDFEVSSAENLPSGLQSNPVPGEKIQLDNGAVFGLAVDFIFANNPDQRIGFFLSRQQSGFDSSAALTDDDIDITHIHFTAMNYYPSGKWEPFALLGLGAANFAPKDNTLKNVTRFSGQIAGGTNYRFSENALLRLELRWIPTFFGGSTTVFCDGGCTVSVTSSVYSQLQANIGLQYRF